MAYILGTWRLYGLYYRHIDGRLYGLKYRHLEYVYMASVICTSEGVCMTWMMGTWRGVYMASTLVT